MIITYQSDPANLEIISLDWKAYRWWKDSDSQIIYKLWDEIKANPHLTYEELCEHLKTAYKEKTVKSSADMYGCERYFEITTRGVLPKIIIYSNNEESCGKK